MLLYPTRRLTGIKSTLKWSVVPQSRPVGLIWMQSWLCCCMWTTGSISSYATSCRYSLNSNLYLNFFLFVPLHFKLIWIWLETLWGEKVKFRPKQVQQRSEFVSEMVSNPIIPLWGELCASSWAEHQGGVCATYWTCGVALLFVSYRCCWLSLPLGVTVLGQSCCLCWQIVVQYKNMYR